MFFEQLDAYPRSRVIVDALEVAARLVELGGNLDEQVILECNNRGFAARLEATPAHAPTAAGTYHWNTYVAEFRLEMAARDWTIKNHLNCPFIISPDKTISIVVMTGDRETGMEFGNPKNQADKGRVLSDAIDSNQSYDLFERLAISHLERNATGTQLWVLLYHVERGPSGKIREIRTELSLPSRFEKKKIVNWKERIVFSSINIGTDPEIVMPGPVEPIDFPVMRRNAA